MGIYFVRQFHRNRVTNLEGRNITIQPAQELAKVTRNG